MKGMQFEPVDTLFFRGGTPFAMDGDPQEDVRSVFPPHPPSMAGAVRAALALANGWDGRSRWPSGIEKVLGSGPDHLGDISLAGPFLLREGQPVFPLPRHVLGKTVGEVWKPELLLRPGRPVVCDLGDDVRLSEPPPAAIAGLEAAEDMWITGTGLVAVLRGEVPVAAELCPSSDLWCDESRIGLERDAATRTAREGMLYSARHVRLKRDVSLGVRVHGVPATWSTPFGRFVPLGGESRLAEVIEWRGDFSIDMPMDKIRKSGRVMVVALTPLDLDPEIVVGRRPLSEVGDATVVSACLPRLLRIGGWDSLTRRPLPVRSVMAPGSVLFCKASDPFRLNVLVKNDGLARVGSRTAQGFGVVAFGSWDDEMEEMT